MTTKTYEFTMKFVLTLDDNDEDWNKLPAALPEGLPEGIAKEFSSMEDYYDGFTDYIIENCGCDVKSYKVVVVDSESKDDVEVVHGMTSDELPNYSKVFGILVANKRTGKYMPEGMFMQALETRDIVIMDDGTGFLVFFSAKLSDIYESVDAESK